MARAAIISPFQHAVGIAFHHAAVHERAGVALVGVADDVFLGAFLDAGRLPFAAGGKPPPPRPRRPDLVISCTICSGVISGTPLRAAA
jgi:hypothetical protein